jgi:DNA-binding LacI/PurR family transcriptional regulator
MAPLPGPPTIKDVAARAGVSKSLVSRVLRESPRVSAERRAAVLRAVEELGYRPNAAARTLVRRRSHVIAVLVTDLHNLFLPEVLAGLDSVLEPAGYTTFVVSGKRRAHTEEEALSRLLEMRVDGVVCATARLKRGTLDAASREAAIVNLTRVPQLPGVDSVVGNDRAGARLVVEHLIELGHRDIAMIGDTEERAGADRIRGYRAAMRRAGLLEHIRVVPGGFTESGGHHATLALLRAASPPSAVVVASDLAALGALDAAVDAGIAVPRQLSIAGYDNTPFAALRHIGLTSVDQSATELGAVAAAALLARIDRRAGPARRVVIEPTLVPRATTGPPGASAR